MDIDAIEECIRCSTLTVEPMLAKKELAALVERCATLEKRYAEAIEDIQSWGAYASDYFKEKHGLALCILDHKSVQDRDGGATEQKAEQDGMK